LLEPDMTSFLSPFYSALADGFPVDQAVTEGRKSLLFSNDSPSWGSLVLCASESGRPVFGESSSQTSSSASPAPPSGELIYSGGGMAGGVDTHVGGTVVGRDVIGWTAIPSSSGTGSTSAKGESASQQGGLPRLPRALIESYMGDLERAIKNESLQSEQRQQAFSYFVRLQRLLATDNPDRVELERVISRISQVGPGVADAAKGLRPLVGESSA
jgi:hypothetical protein